MSANIPAKRFAGASKADAQTARRAIQRALAAFRQGVDVKRATRQLRQATGLIENEALRRAFQMTVAEIEQTLAKAEDGLSPDDRSAIIRSLGDIMTGLPMIRARKGARKDDALRRIAAARQAVSSFLRRHRGGAFPNGDRDVSNFADRVYSILGKGTPEALSVTRTLQRVENSGATMDALGYAQRLLSDLDRAERKAKEQVQRRLLRERQGISARKDHDVVLPVVARLLAQIARKLQLASAAIDQENASAAKNAALHAHTLAEDAWNKASSLDSIPYGVHGSIRELKEATDRAANSFAYNDRVRAESAVGKAMIAAEHAIRLWTLFRRQAQAQGIRKKASAGTRQRFKPRSRHR